MTTDDPYAALRAALAAGPTPGPWESVPVMYAGTSADGLSSWGESEGRVLDGPPQTVERETLSARWFSRKEDAAYIAACSPDTIASLLAAADERVTTLLRAVNAETHAQRLQADLDDERARAERLAADSKRYQWLRDRHETHGDAAEIVWTIPGKRWDAAIDAALAGEPETKL